MKFRHTGSGKGDGYRPVDKKKYDKNWDQIFKSKRIDSDEKQEKNKTVSESD